MSELSCYKVDLRNAVVFDTETSGLARTAEICEISIINLWDEKTLFSKVIKTKNPIPKEATEIHGITNEMSQKENSIDYWWNFITGNLLAEKTVIGYNVNYDIRMLHQSFEAWNPSKASYFKAIVTIDVMPLAAEFLKSKKWLSLKNACQSANLPLEETRLHGSEYDSIMTSRLFKKIISMESI